MAYTARSRDRFKSLAAVVTGVTTFASVGVAGAATGLAARQTALGDQAGPQGQASQGASQARLQRPTRTVVRTRILHRVSVPGVAAVGPGGLVTAPAPPAVGASGGGGSSMPPALPPPAPTSGS